MTRAPFNERAAAARYAKLLRAYPRSWRDNGKTDEILGVLLDGAEADNRAGPELSEALNLVANGLVARTKTASFVLPSPARLRIAQTSIAIGAALAAFCLLFGELRIRGLSDGQAPYAFDQFLRPRWGPVLGFGTLVYASWLATTAAFTLGRNRLTAEIATFTTALTLLTSALAHLAHHQRPPGGLLATLAVLSIGASALPQRKPLRRADRLIPLVAAACIAAALGSWQWTLAHGNDYWNATAMTSRPMFYWCADGNDRQINRVIAGPALPILITFLIAAALMWRIDRSWLTVGAFLAIPTFTLRLGRTNFAPPNADRDVLIWTAAAVGVVVAQAVVVRRIQRRRRERRRAQQTVDSSASPTLKPAPDEN